MASPRWLCVAIGHGVEDALALLLAVAQLGQPLVGVIAHEALRARARRDAADAHADRAAHALRARRRDADQRRDLLARQAAARRRARRRLDRLDAHLRAQRALAAQRLARDRARELLDVQRLADHEALDRLADLLGEARHVHALVRRVEVDRALELRGVEPLLAAVRDADDALDPGHPGARQRDAHARGGGLHVVPQRDVFAGGPAHAPDRTRVRRPIIYSYRDAARDQSPAPIRQEPASIFEHIDAHVRPGVAGLAEGGAELPDDAARSSPAPGRPPAASRGRGGRADLRARS